MLQLEAPSDEMRHRIPECVPRRLEKQQREPGPLVRRDRALPAAT